MLQLSYDLHALTIRLDRAADNVLTETLGVSYARFLALMHVSAGARTQRELALRLSVSEPSVSRMAGVLSGAGLLSNVESPAGGNRRQLTLTSQGEALVSQAKKLLDRQFSALVDASGIPYEEYVESTRRLLAQLERGRVKTSNRTGDGTR